MAQYPDGVKFLITSRNENQNKGQVEAEFIVDSVNEYYEGNVQEDANNLYQELIATYNQNATKEFYLEKCITYQYEIRPVPSARRITK
jgi:predicted RND superfamily exporter protein